MSQLVLLFPTPGTTGKSAVPETFFALGTYEGTITQVRGRFRPAGTAEWGPHTSGTVKDNGHWFVLLTVPHPEGARYQVEVEGFDGAGWLAPATVEFEIEPHPRYALAPQIQYPPNNNPYVITGPERLTFVPYGVTDSAITKAVILSPAPIPATNFVTQGTSWYATFQNLPLIPTGVLQVTNATGTMPEAVSVQ